MEALVNWLLERNVDPLTDSSSDSDSSCADDSDDTADMLGAVASRIANCIRPG